MPTTRDERLNALARRGAEVRLKELLEEASDLVKMFPPLKDSFDPDELPPKFLLRRGADRVNLKARAVEAVTAASPQPKPRRTRTWTAAQRREVARRMKAYWAAKRKKP